MKQVLQIFLVFILTIFGFSSVNIQSQNQALLNFNFEGNLNSGDSEFQGKTQTFTKGIAGQALSLQFDKNFNHLALSHLPLDGTSDFSIQCWIQTSSSKPVVILSQKQFSNKSISAQKNKGWVLYSSGGSFAWSIGSGDRRLNYERDNGNKMPLDDGEWHQLTMTYDKKLSEVRLYYDGHNKAIYKVGFDFTNNNPLVIGTTKDDLNDQDKIWPEIESGASQLQTLVDEFNALEVDNLKNNEFLSLIVDPDKLLANKYKEIPNSANLKKVKQIRKDLLKNPYTVFQNLELTKLKPISKIYYLENARVKIYQEMARLFTQKTQLFPSDFNLDNLYIWTEVLDADEVLKSFMMYRKSSAFNHKENIKSLNVGVWNIWHGGKHFTMQDHHWDSRMRIVELIKEKDLDVILMQETYSSGDFIAAELGYYFATTSDWDYCFQGSNISVISRYPIKELHVPLEASFMNVGVKLALSETQEIYAMSNWYGMSSFPIVYDFHADKFGKADEIPVLFGGDFNAVPHTDGGDSPAYVKMLENGFKDAYRSLHPNVKTFPGFTHCWGERIDQLYYKGKGLKNKSTEVIHTAFGGFPSDHFMIFSEFELNY